MSLDLEIVVFAFNRGPLLLNCVESIRRFMPGVPITIFDDRSTDARTLAILERLSREGWARVLMSSPVDVSSSAIGPWNGGLYENIQSFVDEHARSKLALFLQDDTQIVRDFSDIDRSDIESIFEANERSAFVYPAFLTYRELYPEVDMESLEAQKPSYVFRHDYEFAGYFDVCIAHISRLRAVGFRFGNELQTSLAARHRFGPMRLLRVPFVAHLPAPPTFRHRGRVWTQRLWEFFRNGVYPVDSLSAEALARLRTTKGLLPTAEHFLTSRKFRGRHPWPYAKFEGAPRWVPALEQIEHRVRYELRHRAAAGKARLLRWAGRQE